MKNPNDVVRYILPISLWSVEVRIRTTWRPNDLAGVGSVLLSREASVIVM
jgi:hypothetical protein